MCLYTALAVGWEGIPKDLAPLANSVRDLAFGLVLLSFNSTVVGGSEARDSLVQILVIEVVPDIATISSRVRVLLLNLCAPFIEEVAGTGGKARDDDAVENVPGKYLQME